MANELFGPDGLSLPPGFGANAPGPGTTISSPIGLPPGFGSSTPPPVTATPVVAEDEGEDKTAPLRWFGPTLTTPLSRLKNGDEYIKLVDKINKGRAGFVEEITPSFEDIPFVGGAARNLDLAGIVSTVKKVERGEKATDQELLDLNLFLAEGQRNSDATFWGKVGSTLRTSAVMGLEIGAVTAATSLTAGGAAPLAGATVGRVSAQKAARETAQKAIYRMMRKSLGNKAMSRLAAGAGGFLAETAVAGATTGGVKLAIEAGAAGAAGEGFQTAAASERFIYGKLTDPEATTYGKALMAGIADQYVEYMSEAAGTGLMTGAGKAVKRVTGINPFKAGVSARAELAKALSEGPLKLTGKPLEKALDAAARFSFVGSLAGRAAARRGVDLTKGFEIAAKMGYDGLLGEMAEERYGGFLRGLLGIDGSEASLRNAWDQAIPTLEQLKVEAVSFAVPIVAAGGAGIALQSKAFGGTGIFSSSPSSVIASWDNASKPKEGEVVVPKGEVEKAVDQIEEVGHAEYGTPDKPIDPGKKTPRGIVRAALQMLWGEESAGSAIERETRAEGRENLVTTFTAIERIAFEDTKRKTPGGDAAEATKTARAVIREILVNARGTIDLPEASVARGIMDTLKISEASPEVPDSAINEKTAAVLEQGLKAGIIKRVGFAGPSRQALALGLNKRYVLTPAAIGMTASLTEDQKTELQKMSSNEIMLVNALMQLSGAEISDISAADFNAAFDGGLADFNALRDIDETIFSKNPDEYTTSERFLAAYRYGGFIPNSPEDWDQFSAGYLKPRFYGAEQSANADVIVPGDIVHVTEPDGTVNRGRVEAASDLDTGKQKLKVNWFHDRASRVTGSKSGSPTYTGTSDFEHTPGDGSVRKAVMRMFMSRGNNFVGTKAELLLVAKHLSNQDVEDVLNSWDSIGKDADGNELYRLRFGAWNYDGNVLIPEKPTIRANDDRFATEYHPVVDTVQNFLGQEASLSGNHAHSLTSNNGELEDIVKEVISSLKQERDSVGEDTKKVKAIRDRLRKGEAVDMNLRILSGRRGSDVLLPRGRSDKGELLSRKVNFDSEADLEKLLEQYKETTKAINDMLEMLEYSGKDSKAITSRFELGAIMLVQFGLGYRYNQNHDYHHARQIALVDLSDNLIARMERFLGEYLLPGNNAMSSLAYPFKAQMIELFDRSVAQNTENAKAEEEAPPPPDSGEGGAPVKAPSPKKPTPPPPSPESDKEKKGAEKLVTGKKQKEELKGKKETSTPPPAPKKEADKEKRGAAILVTGKKQKEELKGETPAPESKPRASWNTLPDYKGMPVVYTRLEDADGNPVGARYDRARGAILVDRKTGMPAAYEKYKAGPEAYRLHGVKPVGEFDSLDKFAEFVLEHERQHALLGERPGGESLVDFENRVNAAAAAELGIATPVEAEAPPADVMTPAESDEEFFERQAMKHLKPGQGRAGISLGTSMLAENKPVAFYHHTRGSDPYLFYHDSLVESGRVVDTLGMDLKSKRIRRGPDAVTGDLFSRDEKARASGNESLERLGLPGWSKVFRDVDPGLESRPAAESPDLLFLGPRFLRWNKTADPVEAKKVYANSISSQLRKAGFRSHVIDFQIPTGKIVDGKPQTIRNAAAVAEVQGKKYLVDRALTRMIVGELAPATFVQVTEPGLRMLYGPTMSGIAGVLTKAASGFKPATGVPATGIENQVWNLPVEIPEPPAVATSIIVPDNRPPKPANTPGSQALWDITINNPGITNDLLDDDQVSALLDKLTKEDWELMSKAAGRNITKDNFWSDAYTDRVGDNLFRLITGKEPEYQEPDGRDIFEILEGKQEEPENQLKFNFSDPTDIPQSAPVKPVDTDNEPGEEPVSNERSPGEGGVAYADPGSEERLIDAERRMGKQEDEDDPEDEEDSSKPHLNVSSTTERTFKQMMQYKQTADYLESVTGLNGYQELLRLTKSEAWKSLSRALMEADPRAGFLRWFRETSDAMPEAEAGEAKTAKSLLMNMAVGLNFINNLKYVQGLLNTFSDAQLVPRTNVDHNLSEKRPGNADTPLLAHLTRLTVDRFDSMTGHDWLIASEFALARILRHPDQAAAKGDQMSDDLADNVATLLSMISDTPKQLWLRGGKKLLVSMLVPIRLTFGQADVISSIANLRIKPGDFKVTVTEDGRVEVTDIGDRSKTPPKITSELLAAKPGVLGNKKRREALYFLFTGRPKAAEAGVKGARLSNLNSLANYVGSSRTQYSILYRDIFGNQSTAMLGASALVNGLTSFAEEVGLPFDELVEYFDGIREGRDGEGAAVHATEMNGADWRRLEAMQFLDEGKIFLGQMGGKEDTVFLKVLGYDKAPQFKKLWDDYKAYYDKAPASVKAALVNPVEIAAIADKFDDRMAELDLMKSAPLDKSTETEDSRRESMLQKANEILDSAWPVYMHHFATKFDGDWAGFDDPGKYAGFLVDNWLKRRSQLTTPGFSLARWSVRDSATGDIRPIKALVLDNVKIGGRLLSDWFDGQYFFSDKFAEQYEKIAGKSVKTSRVFSIKNHVRFVDSKGMPLFMKFNGVNIRNTEPASDMTSVNDPGITGEFLKLFDLLDQLYETSGHEVDMVVFGKSGIKARDGAMQWDSVFGEDGKLLPEYREMGPRLEALATHTVDIPPAGFITSQVLSQPVRARFARAGRQQIMSVMNMSLGEAREALAQIDMTRGLNHYLSLKNPELLEILRRNPENRDHLISILENGESGSSALNEFEFHGWKVGIAKKMLERKALRSSSIKISSAGRALETHRVVEIDPKHLTVKNLSKEDAISRHGAFTANHKVSLPWISMNMPVRVIMVDGKKRVVKPRYQTYKHAKVEDGKFTGVGFSSLREAIDYIMSEDEKGRPRMYRFADMFEVDRFGVPQFTESNLRWWEITNIDNVGWVIPGEIVEETRIPSDNYQSHMPSRLFSSFLRHDANFSQSDPETQLGKGEDFDGDAGYTVSLARDKSGRIVFDDSIEGINNRRLLMLAKDYASPENYLWIKTGVSDIMSEFQDNIAPNYVTALKQKWNPRLNHRDFTTYARLVALSGKPSLAIAAKGNQMFDIMARGNISVRKTKDTYPLRSLDLMPGFTVNLQMTDDLVRQRAENPDMVRLMKQFVGTGLVNLAVDDEKRPVMYSLGITRNTMNLVQTLFIMNTDFTKPIGETFSYTNEKAKLVKLSRKVVEFLNTPIMREYEETKAAGQSIDANFWKHASDVYGKRRANSVKALHDLASNLYAISVFTDILTVDKAPANIMEYIKWKRTADGVIGNRLRMLNTGGLSDTLYTEAARMYVKAIDSEFAGHPLITGMHSGAVLGYQQFHEDAPMIDDDGRQIMRKEIGDVIVLRAAARLAMQELGVSSVKELVAKVDSSTAGKGFVEWMSDKTDPMTLEIKSPFLGALMEYETETSNVDSGKAEKFRAARLQKSEFQGKPITPERRAELEASWDADLTPEQQFAFVVNAIQHLGGLSSGPSAGNYLQFMGPEYRRKLDQFLTSEQNMIAMQDERVFSKGKSLEALRNGNRRIKFGPTAAFSRKLENKLSGIDLKDQDALVRFPKEKLRGRNKTAAVRIGLVADSVLELVKEGVNPAALPAAKVILEDRAREIDLLVRGRREIADATARIASWAAFQEPFITKGTARILATGLGATEADVSKADYGRNFRAPSFRAVVATFLAGNALASGSNAVLASVDEKLNNAAKLLDEALTWGLTSHEAAEDLAQNDLLSSRKLTEGQKNVLRRKIRESFPSEEELDIERPVEEHNFTENRRKDDPDSISNIGSSIEMLRDAMAETPVPGMRGIVGLHGVLLQESRDAKAFIRDIDMFVAGYFDRLLGINDRKGAWQAAPERTKNGRVKFIVRKRGHKGSGAIMNREDRREIELALWGSGAVLEVLGEAEKNGWSDEAIMKKAKGVFGDEYTWVPGDGKNRARIMVDEFTAEEAQARWEKTEAYQKLLKAGRTEADLHILGMARIMRQEFEDARVRNNVKVDSIPLLFHGSLSRRLNYLPHIYGGGFSKEQNKVAQKVFDEINKMFNERGPSRVTVDRYAELKNYGTDTSKKSLATARQRALYEELTGEEMQDTVTMHNASNRIHAAAVRKAMVVIPAGKSDLLTDEELSYIKFAREDSKIPIHLQEYTGRGKSSKYKSFHDAATDRGLRPATMNPVSAIRKYATDVFITTQNKAIFIQMTYMSDYDGTPMFSPVPNLKKWDSLSPDERMLADRNLRDMIQRFASLLGDRAPVFRADMPKQLEELQERYFAKNDNYKKMQAPSENLSYSHVWVKKGDAVGITKHFFNNPWNPKVGGHEIMKELAAVNSRLKQLALSLSAFFTFAIGESATSASGLNKNLLWHPIESWREFEKYSLGARGGELDYREVFGRWVRHGLQVDPMIHDVDLGVTEHDAAKIEAWISRKFGQKAADLASPGVRLNLRYTRWLFGDMLPTFKIMLAERALNEARDRAEEAGVEFDENKAMDDISMTIDAAFGGTEWKRFPWAHPTTMRWLSLLWFAPDWTWSAFSIAGGGLVTQKALSGTRPPRSMQEFAATRYWPSMMVMVLFAIPNILQATLWAGTRVGGAGDPDDKPFTFMNEPGRKTYIDFTPLMRLMPWYDGDKTGKRRVYGRFGKQAYEVLEGWMQHPINNALKKMSQPARIVLEQIFGVSVGSEWDAGFRGAGISGWLTSPDEGFAGSRVAAIARSTLPISIMGMIKNPGTVPFSFIFPTAKGATAGTRTRDLQAVLEVYGREEYWSKIKNRREYKVELAKIAPQLLEAAERNGYEPGKVLSAAKGAVLREFYGEFLEALNKEQYQKLDRIAKEILRVEGTVRGLQQSIKGQRSRYGQESILTEEEMEAITEAFK